MHDTYQRRCSFDIGNIGRPPLPSRPMPQCRIRSGNRSLHVVRTISYGSSVGRPWRFDYVGDTCTVVLAGNTGGKNACRAPFDACQNETWQADSGGIRTRERKGNETLNDLLVANRPSILQG